MRTPRNRGYTAGYQRGQQDGNAEACGQYTRDPSHEGHTGDPPKDLTGTARRSWVSEFLDGYAAGREEAIRGAVA